MTLRNRANYVKTGLDSVRPAYLFIMSSTGLMLCLILSELSPRLPLPARSQRSLANAKRLQCRQRSLRAYSRYQVPRDDVGGVGASDVSPAVLLPCNS